MNNNQLVQFFLDLVRIDSPTGEEDLILSYLFEYIKEIGLIPIYDSYGNLIVKIDGVGKPVLLSAHVDTVEPGRNITPIIEKGIIRSDGKTILGADNKVGLAVILNVITQLKDNKNIKHRPIEVVFTKSEEVANLGAINLDYKLILAKEGYLFDNCNPVGTIIQASPFYYRFDVSIIGKSAHASSPHKAINVLPVFAEAISKFKLGKVTDTTIANIGKVTAGYVRNSIPGEMIINGEVRGYIDQETKNYVKTILNCFKNTAKNYNCKIKSTVVCENPGYLYKSDDQFIKNTMQIMKKLNIQPRLQNSLGCSDANIFQEHGIKVLDIGDGSEHSHTNNESIAISEMEKLNRLVLSLVK